MSGSRLRPYLGPLVALLIVLALGAGTVYAAIPNGNGTYYACLTKSSGMVRLINYPKVKCATGERFIKWSQQGPAGPAGVQGVQGPKGDPGPAGASGSSNWGDINNKPADLDDGQIGWGEVANKPADFADGVDNEGVTAVKIKTVTSTTPAVISTGPGIDTADCPAGFLAVGGGFAAGGPVDYLAILVSHALDEDTWQVAAYKSQTAGNTELYAQVICLRAEPAGLVITAKNSHYGPKKAKLRTHDG